MSAIAELLLNLGYKVSGSDIQENEITRKLAKAGAGIYLGHSPKNIRHADLVVASSAINEKNPEIKEALKTKIPVLERAVMLANLAQMKKTITVAGTHGKTTTTSMAAVALQAAGADPTIITGGVLKNIGSNAKLGSGDYFVAEADESDGSFVYMSPLAAIVTNIDTDHLDHYGSMRELKQAFVDHLSKIQPLGAAIICADDKNAASLLPKIKTRVISYGLSRTADWQARNIKINESGSSFQAWRCGRKAGNIKIQACGEHNVLNALAVMACGIFLGFDFSSLAKGLAGFAGVGRRMEKLGAAGGINFIDDYGHHPTEIKAVIKSICRGFKYERLAAVFQPHRYTRTAALHKELGRSFKGCDMLYVMDIYPAGEKAMKGISSGLILNSARKAGIPAFPFTRPVDLIRHLKKGDLLLTIGAGDVWKAAEDLKRRLRDA